MNRSGILNQKRVVTALERAIEHERVAHAYLFHGPDGVGKRAVALAFAQALLCTEDASAPCGECRDCTKVQRLIHPDVRVLFPQHKEIEPKDVAARIEALAEEPYATVDFRRRPSLEDASKSSNKQVFYAIERIHEELLRPMSFKPVEGAYKIVLLTEVDLMREKGANAFLKLLEEPPPQTVFILTTARPERLLSTIISRCQLVRFDALSAGVIQEGLRSRKGIDADQALMLARMADGSYSRALDILEREDLGATRKLILEFMRGAVQHDIDRLDPLIEQVNRMGRDEARSLLRAMVRWVRDVILYRAAGEEAALVNVDQAERIASFCDNLPSANLDAMVRMIEEASGLVGRNVRTDLVLTVLAQKLGAAMSGGKDDRLYEPLAAAS